MSTVALINKFDGGIAQDPRARSADQYQVCTGFDVFTNPHLLIPYIDSTPETMASGIIDDLRPQEVYLYSTGYITVGYKTSARTQPTVYTKSNINDPWSANGDATVGQVLIEGTSISFRGKMYFLTHDSGTTISLQRADGGAVVTNVGSFSSTTATAIRPFVHPKNNQIVIVTGQSILTYDGTTLAAATLTIPVGYTASSIADYGDNVAFAMNENLGNLPALVGIWSFNTSNTVFDIIVPFGEGSIYFIVNLYNILFAITTGNGAQFVRVNPRLRIKSYSGGSVDTVIDISIPPDTTVIPNIARMISTTSTKNSNKIYFGLNNDYALYAFGKNSEGTYILTQDRYYNNGTYVNTLKCVSLIGDIAWIGSVNNAGVYSLMRTKINGLTETPTYTAVNIYKTLINHGMGLSRYTIQDVHKEKTINAIAVQQSTAALGNIELGYAMDGSTFNDVINQANSLILKQYVDATRQTDGQPLTTGREFELQLSSSGGAVIRQIMYSYSPNNAQL